MKRMRLWLGCLALSAVVALGGAAFGGVEMSQTISLVKGWNAVHVEVADTNDVGNLFKGWPVDWVAIYDPAAFQETRQYSADGSNEGLARTGYRMWHRGMQGVNGFGSVPADSVLVCYVATNSPMETTVRLRGVPAAPRITWHKSSVNEKLNLVGFSTWGETTTKRYFSGLDVGDGNFFVFGGEDLGKPMVMPTTLAGSMVFSNAQVLAVSSKKVSDWSGVLNVSPRDGVDFGVEGTKAALEIRNDGATNAVVTVRMTNEDPKDPIPVPQGIYVRDSLDALTNGPWTAFTTNKTMTLCRELEAGETWELRFALDRMKLLGPSGTVYGAILDIRDATEGGSMMRVNVPIQATGDGGASSEYAWPKGVWLAVAELDEVSYFLTKEGDSTGKPGEEGVKPAGGKMKVRLPLYVDERGAMTLLQRFWYGRDTNGVLRAYSGAIEESDVPLTDVKRVSTAFLPADMPQLSFGSSNLVFGTYARADFIVHEKSNVNPMRHAQHPQHDGLMADYLGDTPSGDDVYNYVGTVKPEAFSVLNSIEFTWDEHGATSWNPEEKLSGVLKWEFGGLRHERTIQARGRFSMERLSPVTMMLKREE